MSTRNNIIAATASAGVLAVGWAAGAHALVAPPQQAAEQNAGTATTATEPQTTTTSSTTTTAPADATSTTSSQDVPQQSTSTQETTTQDAGTASTASSGGLHDGTYTGSDTSYEYGSVSVTLTVSGGRITAATTQTTVDGGGHSQRIQDWALPDLDQAVVDAQSDQISTVSGATYTSEAYITSLQSALDKARA